MIEYLFASVVTSQIEIGMLLKTLSGKHWRCSPEWVHGELKRTWSRC